MSNSYQNPYVQAIVDLDEMAHQLSNGFEFNFVSDNRERVEEYGDRTRFTLKQREIIDELVERYLGPYYAAELQGQAAFRFDED